MSYRLPAIVGAVLILLATPSWLTLTAAQESSTTISHGFAVHGDLKYGPDFTHFDYVNPAAPKGGDVVLSANGSFDSLNGYILKGDPAAGLGLIYDTLLVGSSDEPFSSYGSLAQSVKYPEDRSWVIYTLRPEARWHDGIPLTADDVVWTYETLTTQGHPQLRSYWGAVESVEKLDSHRIRFNFGPETNREMPSIVGQMPILPKHWWEGRDFTETTLDVPLGSGPYRIANFDAGRSITYERVADYWGQNVPVNVGQNNFTTMRYDYYRDRVVEREALKGGAIDFFQENVARIWATGYDTPAVRDGLLVKEEIANEVPQGMQGFAVNTRKPALADRRVRQALTLAMDFEWMNETYFFNAYRRSRSFFTNTDMEAKDLPGSDELALLEPWRDQLPPEVFTEAYQPPSTDGSGDNRVNLRRASSLLDEAGWPIVDGKRVNTETGESLTIEFLLISPAFETITLAYVQALEPLGVDATVRTVDSSQYVSRLDAFDFDIVIDRSVITFSPGNEQLDSWGTESADIFGGGNLVGVRDPVVDYLIDRIIDAPDYDSLITASRALDRVLQWGFYYVPHWHLSSFRVAYWNKFDQPAIAPRYALGFGTWWVDEAKVVALATGKPAVLEDAQ